MADLLPGPGAVRLILALMIVAEHISGLRIGGPAFMAVFVLSGYWVARSWDLRYRQLPRPEATFWLSRILRLWPLYAVVFLGTTLVLAQVAGRYDPATWAGLPILGLASHGLDRIGIAWSLDILLQFYLLLPLLWALAGRTGPAGAALWVLAAAAAGWALILATGLVLLPAFLPLFALGWAAHARGWRVPLWGALAAGAGFVLVAGAALVLPDWRGFVIGGSGSFGGDKLFALVWVLPLVPALLWSVRRPSGAADRLLGEIAYPVFLLHYPVIVTGRALLGRDYSAPEKLALVAAVLAAALVLHLVLGRPLEALRQRVVRGRAARPLAGESA
ncbi:acyltransferase family protein [Halovulum marinum]|nr:acyltransferase family protein [Halovulum marinum]